MILGSVSYLDCIVFCVFLAPQLIIHVGLLETVLVGLQCLPFLCESVIEGYMENTNAAAVFQLPFELIRERYFVRYEQRSPFVQKASLFEDLVIRCVRYAFANIPPKVGRVFFSKPVALPFLKFRMLRHGYLRSPIYWHEHNDVREFSTLTKVNASEGPTNHSAEAFQRNMDHQGSNSKTRCLHILRAW